MTSTTPVAGPSGPVSKLPLAASPESFLAAGQAGFAEQFQDFQESARIAAVGSGGARVMAGSSGRSARQTASTTKTVTAPVQAAPEGHPALSIEGGVAQNASPAAAWLGKIGSSARPSQTMASGATREDGSTGSAESGVAQEAIPAATWLRQTAFQNLSVLADSGKIGPSARPSQTMASGATREDGSTGSVESGVPQNVIPAAVWLPQTAFQNPSAPTDSGKIGPSACISHTPPADVAQALVPAVSRLISTRVRAGDKMSRASVGMSARPQGGTPAGKSARATSSDSNTWEKVGLARPSRSSASGATREDGSTGSIESGVAQNASPATTWLGKIGPSARPSQTMASGATHEDGSTGSAESGVAQNASPAAAWLPQAASPNPVRNLAEWATPVSEGAPSPAAKKETGSSEAAALGGISLQPLPPQPPLVSAKHFVTGKNGSKRPASGASSSAAAAPEVTAHQAPAAAATAHLPLLEAAPLDDGITPPAERSSTPEKAGQPVNGPDPRAVNTEAGTPTQAEPAPADLAFAVRVKAQAGLPASGESAPAKELRRVDLADAPPAASLRTETFRAGAWVLNEGPARGVPQATAETASRPPERPEAPPIPAEEAAPKAAGPLKDLSVQVKQPNQESVELRVAEREGELHVAVRTGDAELAHGLRQGLPELVDRLDQGGFRTEAWRPSGVVSAPEPSSQAHSRPSDSRNADSQSQPGWSQQERGQRDHNQSNRPKWVEELEGNLTGGGERSTGEFHGFSH